MPPQIADFSSSYFYDSALQSSKENTGEHLLFYDTAGANFDEKKEETGSISNPDELDTVVKSLDTWKTDHDEVVFISPYAGQVELAKTQLENIRVSTIDSFQGQEADVIIQLRWEKMGFIRRLLIIRRRTGVIIVFLS